MTWDMVEKSTVHAGLLYMISCDVIVCTFDESDIFWL